MWVLIIGGRIVSANKELKERFLDEAKIKEAASLQKIKWHFNSLFAPHFDGVFKIKIKSAKPAVYDQFKSPEINDGELLSAFADAESLIYSRPLTYQSADAPVVSPITPNHFLLGQLGGQFTPEVEERMYYGVKVYLHYKTITSKIVSSEAPAKILLFRIKVLFRSQDIQDLVFFTIP